MNISNLINMKYGTRRIKVVFNLWKRLEKIFNEIQSRNLKKNRHGPSFDVFNVLIFPFFFTWWNKKC